MLRIVVLEKNTLKSINESRVTFHNFFFLDLRTVTNLYNNHKFTIVHDYFSSASSISSPKHHFDRNIESNFQLHAVLKLIARTIREAEKAWIIQQWSFRQQRHGMLKQVHSLTNDTLYTSVSNNAKHYSETRKSTSLAPQIRRTKFSLWRTR